MAGKRPSPLLGDLEAHRLGALGVVGAQVDVDDAPAVAVADLRAEPVHAVVVATHADERRAIDGGAHELGGLEVLGHEDDRAQARRGRARRHRVGEVPGRRAADRVHAELPRLAERHRHQPVLERQRGMTGRVVLHPEVGDAEALAEAGSGEERGEAGAVADGRLTVERKQLPVPPEVAGPRSDRLPCEAAANLVEVVDRLEAAPALGAGRHRVLGLLLPALLASQPDHSAHSSTPHPVPPHVGGGRAQKKPPAPSPGALPPRWLP